MRPFKFERDGDALVDGLNNLQIRMEGGPEYTFSVVVIPFPSTRADAWPSYDRWYFKFHYDGPDDKLRGICRFSRAKAYQPFDRDYPGRTAELLETIVPLIIPVGRWGPDFPELLPGVEARISDLMVPLLIQRGRYSWFDDEPEAEPERRARAEKMSRVPFTMWDRLELWMTEQILKQRQK